MSPVSFLQFNPQQWLQSWALQMKHRLSTALKNPICGHCQQETQVFTPFCPYCQVQLGFRELRQPVQVVDQVKIYAVTDFNDALKGLLYPYKFYQRKAAISTLVNLYLEGLTQLGFQEIQPHQPAVIIPIPSRWSGNHLWPLVKGIQNRFGYPILTQGLIWQRETQPQHRTLNRHERLQNLKQSMVVNIALIQSQADLKELQVILIDDMTTTGATFQEAIRALTTTGISPQQITPLALSQVPLQISFEKPNPHPMIQV